MARADDAKIVWLRASGQRWKEICWKVGLARAAANEHWLYALCVMAHRLNGSNQISKSFETSIHRESPGIVGGLDIRNQQKFRRVESSYVFLLFQWNRTRGLDLGVDRPVSAASVFLLWLANTIERRRP